MCQNKYKYNCVSMPIKQITEQHDLSLEHGKWLEKKFNNVNHQIIDLTDIFNNIQNIFTKYKYDNLHSFANTRSRLRMIIYIKLQGVLMGLSSGLAIKLKILGRFLYKIRRWRSRYFPNWRLFKNSSMEYG
ncbi:MAG: hypothetical protein CM1200mP33_2780 [Chloroflexota bacterium]|nr:MAG: hypothetical protein CM1200mP33_2780 [Chloroflexota bacterium]